MNIKFFTLLIAVAAFGFSACGGDSSNANLAGKAANATNTVIKETSNLANSTGTAINSTGNAVNSMIKEITPNSNTAVNKSANANTANSKMTNSVNKSGNRSERDGDK